LLQATTCCKPSTLTMLPRASWGKAHGSRSGARNKQLQHGGPHTGTDKAAAAQHTTATVRHTSCSAPTSTRVLMHELECCVTKCTRHSTQKCVQTDESRAHLQVAQVRARTPGTERTLMPASMPACLHTHARASALT